MQANLNTNDPIDSQECSQDFSTGIDYFLTPPRKGPKYVP